jgi:hypothetical protein
MASLRSGGYVDPGWEHGVPQDDRKKKVRCNYCAKVVSGGIYRLKQHLARISGEVTYCEKAPEEVYRKMRENLEGCRFSKKPRQFVDYDEQTYLNFNSNDDVDEDENSGYRTRGKQLVGDKGLVINLAPLRSLGYVDPGWEHGVPQDDRKKKVKCNYCEKIVSGGINRFKQHLARIPGEVAPCKNAPEEVFLKIKENMKWHRTGRRQRRPNSKELSSFYTDNEEQEEEQEEEEEEEQEEDAYEKLLNGDKMLSRVPKRACKGMMISSGSGSEPSFKRPRSDISAQKSLPNHLISPSFKQVKFGSCRKSRKEVLSAICKFFYHAGIPSHAANSPYFGRMLELVGQYGHDLVGPSNRAISGRYLHDEISTIKSYLNECKASWAVTGCSVLADSWKDTRDRTIINILVSCPRGMYFVRSVDVTDYVEDPVYLFNLLDRVVEEMGVENVVQVITENTNSYRNAGKMLEDKRKNLYWTPCAAYCLEQLLEDLMQIKWVSECMEKCRKISKLIYNRSWLLNLLKKEFTNGQDLLTPLITQYSSSFASLLNFVDHKGALKRLFQSNRWLTSKVSKSEEGKDVEKIVMNSTFWKKMVFVCRSVEPIVEVLQKVNGDERLSMPFIYSDIYRARSAIKTNHGEDVRKYGPFWNVIDSHLNLLAAHPLYLASYYLNPSYRYSPDFVPHPEVVRGLNACIVRLESDSSRRISASMQIPEFGTAKADFGTELAIATRTEINPAAWWEQHGINCLELQRIAVRILSQTCSSFGCEHNWSMYDEIHSPRNNRISQKRLNDHMFVHYNLRLRELQIRKRSNESISIDTILQESLLHDWIAEVEKPALQEDEEILGTEMDQVGGYENEMEFEDGNMKECEEDMVCLGDAQQTPLDTNSVNNFGALSDDEDDDLNFLDDDLSC